MNVFTSLERFANAIGQDFGGSNSKTQADLFNGFADMYENSMHNKNDREMQAAYIAADLTPAAKRVLFVLSNMANFKED